MGSSNRYSSRNTPKHQRDDALYAGRGRVPASDIATLSELLMHHAQVYPEQAALMFESESLTYLELASSAQTLAAWMIHEADIKPGDRVAIYLPNTLSYVVAVYATWLARAVVVNLGVITGQDEVLNQMQDSSAKLLITTASLLADIQALLLQTGIRHIVTTQRSDYANLGSLVRGLLSPDRWLQILTSKKPLLVHTRLREILSKRSPKIDWPKISASDAALLQYTSGTMGDAKGVILTHDNLLSSARQGAYVLGRSLPTHAVILCPVTFQHILGMSTLILSAHVAGAIMITSINRMMEDTGPIRNTRCDVMIGIPLLYDQLLKKSPPARFPSSLTLFVSGGSNISLKLQQQWKERTGHYIVEGYGLSETSPLIAITPPNRVRLGTSGVITPETEVRIISNQGVPVGFNQAGELWVRGPQVMRGYWQRPQASSEVLSHDGWFRTGDIVSLDEDGYLRVLERKKDVFWVQNELVFPKEIETVAAAHEDVIDCVAIQDELDVETPITNTHGIIKLFVVARDGLTPERLAAYLQSHLKSSEIPDHIIFVDKVPRGAMGKVIRRLLKDIPARVVAKVSHILKAEPTCLPSSATKVDLSSSDAAPSESASNAAKKTDTDHDSAVK